MGLPTLKAAPLLGVQWKRGGHFQSFPGGRGHRRGFWGEFQRESERVYVEVMELQVSYLKS